MANSSMDQKPTFSDLLALRDGESADPTLGAAVAADTESLERLGELTRLKAELGALPPVTPGPEVWQAIQERSGLRSPWLQRFPLATAATVFLAAALAVVLWNPQSAPTSHSPAVAGVEVNDPLAPLVLRSQRLESELLSHASAAATGGVSSSEEALMFGIADVDAQLNALYEAERFDPAERERLWRQRVMLLESLAEAQRNQAMLRPAVY